MDNVTEALGNPPATSLATFARSFGKVDYTVNQTELPNFDQNGNITSYSPLEGNCNSLNIFAVSIITASPDHAFESGNGYGTLSLTSAINRTSYDDVTGISVGVDVAGSDTASAFRNATLQSWNATFSALNATDCKNNIILNVSRDGFYRYDINQAQPVNVSLSVVGIEVSAY
jgi:hypothetical protein